MNKIFNLGITEELSTYLKGKVILANQLAFILFCVGFVYGALTISFAPITLLSAIGMVLCIVVLLLNYLKFYSASRILIALMPITVLSLIHATIVQLNDPLIVSLSIGYIAISIIPFLIFDIREKKLMLPTIIIVWCVYMLQDHTNQWIKIPMDSSLFYKPFMINITNLINICIITFGLIFFQLKNYKSEKENEDLILKLQEQKEKLANQKDFIERQNEKTILVNASLEEKVKTRTSELSEKNELLNNYFENMPGVVYHGKVDGSIRPSFVSKGSVDVIGKTASELVEKGIFNTDIIEPDYLDKIVNISKQARQNLEIPPGYEYTYPIKTNTGRKWILDKGNFTKAADGALFYDGIWLDVTDKVETENKLRDRDQQLKYLLDSSEDMITLHDEKGKYLYYNGPKCFDIQPNEIVGKTPYDLFDQVSAQKITSYIDRVFQTGKSFHFENQLDWQGSKKWFLEYIYPVRDQEGKIKSVAKVCRDIDSRKIAEQRIKESEEKLSLIYNNVNVFMGMFKVKNDGTFILESINKSFLKHFQLDSNNITEKDLIGIDLVKYYELITNYDKNKIAERIAIFNQIVKEKKSKSYEGKYTFPNNTATPFFFSSNLTPILNREGDCTHILFITEDISERIKSANELKSSKEQLSLIYNNTQDFMGLFRVEGGTKFIVESVNATFGRLLKAAGLKLTEDDFLEKDLVYLLNKALGYSEELITERIKVFQKIAKEKKIVTYKGEIEIQPNKKTKLHYENTVSPILDSNGNCTHILFVTKDISKQKKVELELKASESHSKTLFEHSPIIIWEEDFSAVKSFFETLKEKGITDFRAYFDRHPGEIKQLAALIKVKDVNQKSLEFYGIENKEKHIFELPSYFIEASWDILKEELIALALGATTFESEIPINNQNGEIIHFIINLSIPPEYLGTWESVIVSFIDISERKKTELLLEHSKIEIQNQLQRNQLILETTLDGYILTDTNAAIVDVNPAYCKLMGYSREELLKMNILDNLELQITETEIERRIHQLEKKGRVSIETKHIRKDGGLIDLSCNLSLIQSNGEQMIAAFVRDITDQKKAKLLLAQSRKEIENQLHRNQRILETTFDGYILGDKDANIIDVNDAYCQLIGYSKEELLKMKIYQLTKTETKEKAKQIIINGGARYETKHFRKDGITINFDVNMSVIDFNGEPMVASFQRDITDQKKAQLLLEQSREEINKQLELNQLILNTTLDGYVLVDSNADVVDVNPAYCELIGYSREELLKMNIIDLEVKFSQKEVELQVEYLKENGSNRVESKHFRKDGTIIDVDTNLNLLQFEGKPMIAGFVRDITAEKQARKELKYRLNFESLLTKISAKFINLPLYDLERGINNTLEQICKFIGFDRAFLVLLSYENNDGSIHHEWFKPGIDSIKDAYQNVPSDDFPWFINKIKNNELIVVKNPEDLPEVALPLKMDLQNRKIHSQIHVPLKREDKVIGFIGYDALGKIEEWPKDLEVLLRFAGEMITNVLQRKKGEQAIINSEQQLSMIYNNTNEYVGLVCVENENNFVIESLNKKTIDVIKMIWPKLDTKQLIGAELSDVFRITASYSDEQLKDQTKLIKQLIKSKKEVIYQGIIPIPFKGKEFFAYEANLIPIVNPQGDCNYILFVTQDITDRKIAENTIKVSEQRLSTIYNNNMDFISLLKVGLNNQYIIESINNPGMEFIEKNSGVKDRDKIIGLEAGQFFRAHFKEPEDRIKRRIKMVNRAVKEKKRIIFQNRLTPFHKDQEEAIFETVVSPILENGKCVQVLYTARNITENAKAKNLLIQSEKRMSSVFNGTKDQMAIFDIEHDGRIVLEQVNDSFKNAWKKAGMDFSINRFYRKDLEYYHRVILKHPKQKTKEIRALLQQVLVTKNTCTFEDEYQTPNGEKNYIDINISPILNEKGNCEKLLFVARDITFKKKANEQMILKILETEDRERKRISKELHDSLGQNLTTASLNLNFLKNAITQIDDSYKIKFQKGIKFLNNAIDESRNIAHNLMPQSIVDFGYVMTIESLLEDLEGTVDTTFVFYNNLQKVRLAPYKELSLFRITQEAINNILKHAEASKATLQLMKYNNSILLTIEDNGNGFEIEKKKGHSFGLDSMKTRVSALSGTIDIDSNPGKGTSITIEIPT